tara:strand:+ start:1020 stop:1340 length:321 start_codon:yes stop_codon:yes gene_type:complete
MNRYTSVKKLQTPNNNIRNSGIVYGDSARYPLVPLDSTDIYAITEWGDRFESLAFRFYGDVTLWWIISIANPNIVDFSSIFIPIGSTIRIPQNISPIIDNFVSLNR